MLSPRQLGLLLETWHNSVLNRLWMSHGERSCYDWQLVVLSTGSSMGKPPSCFHTSGVTTTSLASIHWIFSFILERQVQVKTFDCMQMAYEFMILSGCFVVVVTLFSSWKDSSILEGVGMSWSWRKSTPAMKRQGMYRTFLKLYSKEIESAYQRGSCLQMFTGTLYTVMKTRCQNRCH